jgi:DNA repair protein RecN (Recombination protein N)
VLHELSITSLGVISSARLPLRPGLTVVTGETGAGKTMVLTGLGLILGGKATPDAVRVGATEAVAEAIYDVPEDSEGRALAVDAGVVFDDDGTVTVVRTVGSTTRSRSILGGRTVPQALLAQVGEELVTVHGQADQVRLRTPARQRQLLDTYAGSDHGEALAQYRLAWSTWRDAADALARMLESEDVERTRLTRLSDELAALDAAAVRPGERAELEATGQVLAHAESLRSLAATAHDALAGDTDVTAAIHLESARRALDEATTHDPSLQALATRVAGYLYGATDAAQELASYLDRLEADPAQLDAMHHRLSTISAAERRFGRAADELEPLRASIAQQLGVDAAWEDRLEAAKAAHDLAHARMVECAATVTQGRSTAAQQLAAHVEKELSLLAMPDATIQMRVEPREPGPFGADDVSLLLSAHTGAPARPVTEAASGGELSRIMLAIEVSLAEAGGPAHTFVFDEVDAGVGGKAAQAVGQRLAALARSHQVLVVTHLAQVAACAAHHVVVSKASDGAVTVSQVREVTGDDRITEIARLLSGEQDSASARAHAVELLENSHVAP